MAHFDENSIEYLSNGHFNIDNYEFMSIWTYKEIYNLLNETEKNSKESDQLIIKLNLKGIEHHTCKPEIGKFGKVCIFPIEELMNFYNQS